MRKSSRVLIAAATAVVLAGGTAATAYAAHYRDRALPGRAVAGLTVSGQTRSEVAASIRERAEQVRLTVTTPKGERTASLADLGYAVDVDATVERVFAPNDRWSSYPRALFSSESVEAVVSVDQKQLDAYVAELAATAGVPAANASVQLGEGGTTFTVTPAAHGTTVDPASLEEVRGAARTLTAATVDTRFVEVEATVSTAAAQAVADKANAIVALPVAVSEGKRTFEASAREKASWLQIPVVGGVPGEPTLAADKVAAWVTEKAGSVAAQPTKGVRNISSTGAVLSVSKQAKDGKEVTNADRLATELTSRLAAGQAWSGTFETTVLPATWTERKVAAGAENLAYPAAEGEKWVDVNLSNHTMTAYEGGRAVIGPVSMVNGASATPTVTGTYKIYAKYAKQTMRGENADGTNYEAPDVPWVAYFHRGYALHGAPWRSSFGYTGSHGCVNLPVPTAGQVYAWAPIGTTVVSHY